MFRTAALNELKSVPPKGHRLSLTFPCRKPLQYAPPETGRQRQTGNAPCPVILADKSFWKGWGVRGKGNLFPKRFPFPPCKNKQQTTTAYTLKNRSRSALLTTEKEDRAMAVPAIMGESMGPPKRCSRPAATGRPSRL